MKHSFEKIKAVVLAALALGLAFGAGAGVVTESEAVAMIMRDEKPRYYRTLSDATTCAKEGETIVLLKDSKERVKLTFGRMFDVNGKNYTGTVRAVRSVVKYDSTTGVYTALPAIAQGKYADYESFAAAVAAEPSGTTIRSYDVFDSILEGGSLPELILNEDKLIGLAGPDYFYNFPITVERGELVLYSGRIGKRLTVAGGTVTMASSYLSGDLPVKVTAGTLNVSHSLSGAKLLRSTTGPALVLGRGVSVKISDGVFFSPPGVAPIALDMASTAAGEFPTHFITAGVNEYWKETGYPLFSSRIPSSFIAEGYVLKENLDGTYTVTAHASEVAVRVDDFTAKYEKDANTTEDEAQAAADAVKNGIVATLGERYNTALVVTGVSRATKAGGANRADVVEALQAAADEQGGDKTQIGSSTATKSFVEIGLVDVKVSVSTAEESGQAKAVTTNLVEVVYDVKPIVTAVTTDGAVATTVKAVIPADAVSASPVSFRLWLDDAFEGSMVEVTHKRDLADEDPIDVKTCLVSTEGGKRFVDLTWKVFSYAVLRPASVGEKACVANGNLYDKVADALSDTEDPLPANATITLLKDCAETDLPLGADQTIDLNGNDFTGSLSDVAGTETVKGVNGTVYRAAAKVDVPTSPTTTLPIRGYDFTGVSGDYGAYLAENDSATGKPRWMTYVLGTSVKFLPKIVAAPIGLSTVTIRAQDGWAANVPAKAGIAVKFKLMTKSVDGDVYTQYGATSDTPEFPVDLNDIAEKTHWKIRTVFESAETAAEPAESVNVDSDETIGITKILSSCPGDEKQCVFAIPYTKSGVALPQPATFVEFMVAGTVGRYGKFWPGGHTDYEYYDPQTFVETVPLGRTIVYPHRLDTNLPLAVAGYVPKSSITVKGAPSTMPGRYGMTLFSNPHLEAYDALEVLTSTPLEGDFIAPVGCTTCYYYTNGSWKKKVIGDIIRSRGDVVIRTEPKLVEVDSIPMGKFEYFWYATHKGTPTVQW